MVQHVRTNQHLVLLRFRSGSILLYLIGRLAVMGSYTSSLALTIICCQLMTRIRLTLAKLAHLQLLLWERLGPCRRPTVLHLSLQRQLPGAFIQWSAHSGQRDQQLSLGVDSHRCALLGCAFAKVQLVSNTAEGCGAPIPT